MFLTRATHPNAAQVLIYDTGPQRKGALLHKLSMHTGNVICVAWCPGQDLLATAGEDGRVGLFTPSLSQREYIHLQGAAYGCDWGVYKGETLLASSCLDGLIYLHTVQQSGRPVLMTTLSGHLSKTFGVKFSPILEGRLASRWGLLRCLLRTPPRCFRPVTAVLPHKHSHWH